MLDREDVFGGVEFLDKLIEELESAFPPLNPRPSDTLSDIMYKSGQRSVVEYLLSKSNVQ